MSSSSEVKPSIPPRKFVINGHAKIAIPLAIQIIVIIGGGITFYFQMTNTLRADIKDTKYEVIEQVNKNTDAIEDVSDDVSDLSDEQKVMKEEILEAVDGDTDRKLLKHRIECHSKKTASCKDIP